MRSIVAGTVVLGWMVTGCAQAGQYANVNQGERSDMRAACEAKARSEKMEITNWHGMREVSPGQFQADVTVQYKGAPYERTCTYNANKKAVDFTDKPGQGAFSGMGAEATVRERAKQACESKARSEKLEVLRWGPFQEASPDIWESDIRVRWKGQDYDRTCVYKDKSQNVDIKDRR
jgi:hypothetical protein